MKKLLFTKNTKNLPDLNLYTKYRYVYVFTLRNTHTTNPRAKRRITSTASARGPRAPVPFRPCRPRTELLKHAFSSNDQQRNAIIVSATISFKAHSGNETLSRGHVVRDSRETVENRIENGRRRRPARGIMNIPVKKNRQRSR